MTKCTIIASVNGVDTPNVEAVAAVLATIADGEEFPMSLRHVLGTSSVEGCVHWRWRAAIVWQWW